MSPAPGELKVPDSSPAYVSSQGSSHGSCFSNLRGVRWRIDLGILPSSSVDDLRRTAADSRRKYARLRRCLLIDPHLSKDDGNKASDFVMDNPLSQNPDSMWGRFFRNAELEKTVDQDLSRLYPEEGSYFQTPSCQALLRRILLLWGLRHPEYGYRQGMHELLAPLLYVLHVDVQHLSQVRELYEDHFSDKFDGMCDQESNLAYTYNFTMMSSSISSKRAMYSDQKRQQTAANISSLDELDPNVRNIVLLNDAYGAEGELGILMSERFMEHDAYCMFDALMSGAGGAVAMVDYYSPSPEVESSSGLPPVIEASSSLYHLLSIVDSSLHGHLVELGVEPQYFALRWLRVLFGREFSLADLLVIWDEIFASHNTKSLLGTEDDWYLNSLMQLSSPRGAFIAALAVAMLLHVRSSLFATENATLCLQRLLNFPENVDVKKLIQKAKTLQALALDTSTSPSSSLGVIDKSQSASVRSYSLSLGSVSPKTPLSLVPESYWEEKWRVLHKAEELGQGRPSDPLSADTKSSIDKEKVNLARTESAPPSMKASDGKKDRQISVRRRLLEDLSRELGDDVKKFGGDEVSNTIDPIRAEKDVYDDLSKQNGREKTFTCMTQDSCLSEPAIATEENSLVFSTSTSPRSCTNEHENDSEKSSVTFHSSTDDNEDETNNEQTFLTAILGDPLPSNSPPVEVTAGSDELEKGAIEQAAVPKERKPAPSKLHWFWKFGRSSEGGVTEKGIMEAQKPVNGGSQNAVQCSRPTSDCNYSSDIRRADDTTDKNVMGTLKNLGQSMLENIQVIESVFQHDRAQVGSLENFSRNILGGKGPVTAMSALTELRKISNLLSEM